MMVFHDLLRPLELQSVSQGQVLSFVDHSCQLVMPPCPLVRVQGDETSGAFAWKEKNRIRRQDLKLVPQGFQKRQRP